jgi:hypothetical protein
MDADLEHMKACLGATEARNKWKPGRNKRHGVRRGRGALGSPQWTDLSEEYRSIGRPICGPATARGIPEPAEKTDQGRCYTRNP